MEIDGTGKHLSPIELRLWTSFLDSSRILETELEAHLEASGMTHREYEILVRVDGAGGRLRMARLARQIESSRQLVGQTVNRLVEKGWVEREDAIDDRRGVDCVLTTTGRRCLAAAAGPHAELVQRLLISPMDPGSLSTTAENLGTVADHLRSHRRGEGCDDLDCPVR